MFARANALCRVTLLSTYCAPLSTRLLPLGTRHVSSNLGSNVAPRLFCVSPLVRAYSQLLSASCGLCGDDLSTVATERCRFPCNHRYCFACSQSYFKCKIAQKQAPVCPQRMCNRAAHRIVTNGQVQWMILKDNDELVIVSVKSDRDLARPAQLLSINSPSTSATASASGVAGPSGDWCSKASSQNSKQVPCKPSQKTLSTITETNEESFAINVDSFEIREAPAKRNEEKTSQDDETVKCVNLRRLFCPMQPKKERNKRTSEKSSIIPPKTSMDWE